MIKLSYPNFDKPFIIECDASNVGVGAVLMQFDDNDDLRPLALASHTLNAAMRNYSATMREAYAIVWALREFEPYILNMDVTVWTDHDALAWVAKGTDKIDPKLMRWKQELRKFKPKIYHKKGTFNRGADFLSRLDEPIKKDQFTYESADPSD